MTSSKCTHWCSIELCSVCQLKNNRWYHFDMCNKLCWRITIYTHHMLDLIKLREILLLIRKIIRKRFLRSWWCKDWRLVIRCWLSARHKGINWLSFGRNMGIIIRGLLRIYEKIFQNEPKNKKEPNNVVRKSKNSNLQVRYTTI